MGFEIEPVGTVESALTDPAVAPKQGDEVIVVTWLHRADRSVLRVHARGDVSRPEQGVFGTRSPDRPTPIGLHRARIEAIEGLRVRVRPLEAVDGRPIIDLKPALSEDVDAR